MKTNSVLQIKKLRDEAIIPNRAHAGDAGMDVYSTEDAIIPAGGDHLFPLGWACSFSRDWVMIIKEKSGRAVNNKLDVGGCVIDSGYRGEVHTHLFNNGQEDVIINKGEKIAQLIMVPCWSGQPLVVKELSNTPRGSGGFGSTGLKKIRTIDY